MRESEKTEFKRTFVGDLNKEVIAFANCDGGEILSVSMMTAAFAALTTSMTCN